MSVGGSSFRQAPGVAVAPQPKSMEEKLRDAAKMYEKTFMREMVKSMRSTVHESEFIKASNAEKIFRDELDQELVNNWSESRGGVGLADMIYDHLVERYGPQLGMRAPVQAPKGPLPLNEKSLYGGVSRSPQGKPLSYQISVNREGAAAEPTPLMMPWDGTLVGKRELDHGSYLLDISHDNGLTSQLVFRGTPKSEGKGYLAGEPIGLLSPEAKSFFWTLVPQESTRIE